MIFFTVAANGIEKKELRFLVNFSSFNPQENGNCFHASGKAGDQWKGKPQVFLVKPAGSRDWYSQGVCTTRKLTLTISSTS